MPDFFKDVLLQLRLFLTMGGQFSLQKGVSFGCKSTIQRDELLNHVPLVVHDAVDTEVQISTIELKELPQNLLKLFQKIIHGTISFQWSMASFPSLTASHDLITKGLMNGIIWPAAAPPGLLVLTNLPTCHPYTEHSSAVPR